MNVRQRLFLVLALISVVAFAGLFAGRYWQDRQLGRARRVAADLSEAMVASILTMEGEGLERFVYDYTYWDDMVEFARTQDATWAAQNIEPSLSVFGADVAWVMNESGAEVYRFAQKPVSEEAMRSSAALAQSALKAGRFAHFLLQTAGGLLEVRGATIHPTSDEQRLTQPAGYFVAGRWWEDETLRRISALTSGTASIEPSGAQVAEAPSFDETRVSVALPGPSWTPAARLTVTFSSPVAREMIRTSRWTFAFAAVLCVALLLAVHLSFQSLVSIPLSGVAKSLATGTPAGPRLLARPDEYGEMARNIRLSQLQRAELERETRERTVAEKALERLTEAIEQAGDSVVITNTAGTMMYVNRHFSAVTGYGKEEAVGRPASLVNSGAHGPEFFRDLWSTIRSGSVWKGRITNRRKNGSLYQEQLTITPVRGADGAIVNFVAIRREITEQVALEALLRQTQRVEAVGRVASGIAHDFNNLLTPILGFAEMLERQSSPNPATLEGLQHIRAAGLRAKELAHRLLGLSRQQELQTQILDLGGLLEQFLPILRRMVRDDVELGLILHSEAVRILGDGRQMELVVMNLVMNAQDAMPGGGRVQIEVSRGTNGRGPDPEFLPESEAPFVELSVRDTGVGMTEEVKARLFEPFFTTKDNGKGTGLGLATVHNIVHLHGGAISVDSSPDSGTVFRVVLPSAPGADRAVRDTAPSDQEVFRRATGSGTVLLCEDEPAVRALCRVVLQTHGYRVLEAESPAHCLSIAGSEHGPIDLLLTDVVMPGRNGKELGEEVRRIRPSTRVLFMSGCTSDVILDHGLTDAPALLQKPFSGSDLVTAVVRALGR